MQTLTLTLAANQTVAFDIAGRYFEVIDSVGLVSVNFYDASGSRTKDLELLKVLSGFFVKGAFSRFEISESSGLAQTITVLYGSTEGGTRRSPGNVRVIDQSYDQTNARNQFLAVRGISDPGNPVVCGIGAVSKACTIKSLMIGSTGTGVIELVTGTGLPLRSFAAQSPVNKLVGQAVATAQACSGLSAYPVTTADLAGVAVVGFMTLAAGGFTTFPLRTPIIVPIGTFFGLASSAGGQAVQFVAEIEE